MTAKISHSAPLISHIKSLRVRKSLPQMLPTSIVIRSESGAPITIPILLEGGLFFVQRQRLPSRTIGMVIGAPLSDLIEHQPTSVF